MGFAVFSSGGVTTPEWNVCLCVVCGLSLAVWLPLRRTDVAPALDRSLTTLLMLFPVYVALQLVPLPVSWLRVLSPARVAVYDATLRLGPGNSHVPLSAAPTVTMAHLLRVLCFICIFFLIRELTWRLAPRPWLATLPVIALGTAEAALGLAQTFGGAPRASGTYVNPNHYSCFLEMTLPVALSLAAIAVRRKHRREAGSLKRVLLASALIGCATCIFLGALYSMSRMSLAAITASLLVLAIGFSVGKADGRFRYLAGACAALVFLGVVFLSVPGALLERLAKRGGQDPLTADARVAIWKETLPMTTDYRFFGSGLGTYVSVFQKYRASAPEYLVDFAHNDYLQLLAELGLIGFAIASAAALLILLRIVRAIRGGATSAQRLLAAGCAAALAALLLDSSVDFDFYIPANAMLAAWIAGIGTAVGIDGVGTAAMAGAGLNER